MDVRCVDMEPLWSGWWVRMWWGNAADDEDAMVVGGGSGRSFEVLAK